MQIRLHLPKLLLAVLLTGVGLDASAQASRLLQGIWQSQRVVEPHKQTQTTALSVAFIGPNRFIFATQKDAAAETDDSPSCAGTFEVREDGLFLKTTKATCPTGEANEEQRFSAEIGDTVLVLIYPDDGTRVTFRRIGKPLPQ